MNKLSENNINSIFANICCSHCKNNFTKNSVKILDKFKSIYTINLTCEKCKKDFGQVLLNFDIYNQKHDDFEIVEGFPAINIDDVIEAHKYIKENL